MNRQSKPALSAYLTRRISKPFLLIALTAYSFNSHSIITRHDRADSQYLELAKQYESSVAFLDKCVATVLSKYWLITAKHCVSRQNKYPVQVTHLQQQYPVADIIVPNQEAMQDWDVALLKLHWPLKNAKAVTVYSQQNELHQIVTFIGNGNTGNGLTGDAIEDKKLRAATNTVAKIEDNWLSFTFDSGSKATDLEGISGNGDSGGPALVKQNGQLALMAVGCCQQPAIDKNGEEHQGAYQSTEYYSRLSPHKTWIDSQVSKQGEEMAASSAILRALKKNKFNRARSLMVQDQSWLKRPDEMKEILLQSIYKSHEVSEFLLTYFPALHAVKLRGLPLTVYAYMQGNGPLLSTLIRLNVGLDATGFRGQQLPTLLTWQYFKSDYANQLNLLINKGLDINHSDEQGNSALHMAVYQGMPERIDVLVSLGANVDHQDVNGSTPLMDAAKRGKKAIIEKLLSNGASTKIRNAKGLTAKDIAFEAGFSSIAKLLQNA